MARITCDVRVVEKSMISPNLTRIVVGDESLSEFPGGYEGGYVKLILTPTDGESVVRSYTVRAHNEQTRTITLEVVSHGDAGPAAAWANRVVPGDSLTIAGPGACQPINTSADWYLLAGDMSAMPAIKVNLERLPTDATGDVILEIIDEQDQVEMPAPAGMRLHWIVNPEPEQENSVLEDTVMSLPWRQGSPSIWVAGEFSASRTLRQYFRHEREVPRDNMYVSCYWKIGTNDEGMKAAKRADPEPW